MSCQSILYFDGSPRQKIKGLANRLLLMMMATIYLLGLSIQSARADITGIVFNDGNNNGIKNASEVGFPYAVVKAYSATGAVVSATTLATPAADVGKFTLTGLSAGQSYRIELTLPAGFTPGRIGTNGASNVRFAQDGASNVDFSITQSGTCGADADTRLVAGCGVIQSGQTISAGSWPYKDYWANASPYSGSTGSGAGVTPHNDDLKVSDVGVPFALALRPNTKHIYLSTVTSNFVTTSSAFQWRAAYPAAPDGPGAVYIANYSGAGYAYTDFKLLVKLHDHISVANQNPITGHTGNTEGGLAGIGGLDFTPDGKTLYVVNMGNGKIVKVNIAGVNYATLPVTAPVAADVSEIAIPTAVSNCTNGFFRPSELRSLGKTLYIAGVCDGGKTGGTAADLRVRVLSMDMGTNAFTDAFSFTPNFKAGVFNSLADNHARWDSTFPGGTNPGEYIQPIVMGLNFDDTGAILLGVANRTGLYGKPFGGYLLRAARTPTGYALENAGVSGPYTSSANTSPQWMPGNSATQYYISGPGNKFFFENGLIEVHDWLYSGGLYVHPGAKTSVSGFTGPLAHSTLGARYHDWSTGLTTGGVVLSINKQFALTGISPVCAAAPMQIGNRVWRDSNSNGTQDPGENGINGVTVELWKETTPGTYVVVGRTVTVASGAAGDGVYVFGGGANVGMLSGNSVEPNTKYQIRFGLNSATAASDFASGGPLNGLTITTANVEATTAASPSANDANDSDALLPNAGPPSSSNLPTISFTSGNLGEDDFNFDAGFDAPSTFSIGNRVWFDTNNDGVNAFEDGASGVLVNVTDSAGVQQYLTPGGAVTNTSSGNTRLSVLTNGNGYYRFDGLPAGNYKVTIDPSNWTGLTIGNVPLGTLAGASTMASGAPLAGYQSSTPGTSGVTGVTTGPTASSGGVNDKGEDKGVNPAAITDYPLSGVSSQLVTLGAGNQPSDDTNFLSSVASATDPSTVSPSGNANDNLAIDFGFFKLTVGNEVWLDNGAGGGTANDGLKTAGELGIAGVRMALYEAGTLVAVTFTDSLGNYEFDQRNISSADPTGAAFTNLAQTNLAKNGVPLQVLTNYQVRISANQAVLAGMQSSNDVVASSATPLTTDNDDNGNGNATTANVISSSNFQLTAYAQGAGTEGTTSTNTDGKTAQPRVDFGMVNSPRYAIGNRVWFDTNNDGIVNVGEVGISGVKVELLDSGNNVLYTLLTDSNGYYLFDNLASGVYSVRIAQENWTGIQSQAPVGKTGAANSVSAINTQPLAGYANSTSFINQTSISFNVGDNNKDHGVDNPTPATTGGITSASFTLGTVTVGAGDTVEVAPGSAPNSTPGDGADNLTIDFGFYRLSVGNFVWRDNGAGVGGVANDGLHNGTELGIGGVNVDLYEGNTLVASTTTNSSGIYVFDKKSNDNPLLAGINYQVRIPGGQAVLAGLQSSADPSSASTPLSTDQDDQGIGTAATTGVTTTGNFQLLAYAEGAGTNGTTSVNASGTTNQPRIDLAFYGMGVTVGNFVWIDSNSNGVQDSTEIGIDGVTATISKVGGGAVLDTAGNPVTTSQTTTGGGLYQFTNLAPGQYLVNFSNIPTNYTVTTTGSALSNGNQSGVNATDSNGLMATSASLSFGQSDLTLDLGLVPATVSVGNYVWYDSNGNGIQDGTEAGLAGVVLGIFKADGVTPATTQTGAVIPNQTTSATGAYLFTNLTPAEYVVKVISAPTGYVPTIAAASGSTLQNDSSTMSALSSASTGNAATPGGSDLSLDFGFVQQTGVTVGNFVWSDVNGNGTQDPSELGIDGVTVTLSKVGGGSVTDVLGTNLTSAQLTQVTAGGGYYKFTNLAPGQYITTFSNLPAGYSVTITGNSLSNGNQSGANANDSNGLSATSAVLAVGQSDLTLDLGLVPRFSLGNRVWLDSNNNGVLDAGESGIDGLMVNLLDGLGNPTGLSTTTSLGGYYQFTSLLQGNYIVEVVPILGTIKYATSTGSNGNLTGPYEPGSNEFAAGGNNKDHGSRHSSGNIRSGMITLAQGMATNEGLDHPAGLVDNTPDNHSNRTIDFGLFRPASLGNLVWLDDGAGNPSNARNGKQDAGEVGINGVTINLFDSSGTKLSTTVSNNNPVAGTPGWYEIGNLIPGNYQIEFILPPNFTFTNQGAPAASSGSPTDTNNSQPTAALPRTQIVALAAGDNNPQLDAGVVAVPQEIPTLSMWMLFLLSAMMMLFAWRGKAQRC